MHIVLSANRPNLEGEIDPRFGRCRYLVFVDPETLQYEAEENPSLEAASGAGINTAQFVANKGADVLITGNIGPNAYQVLSAAGIEMFTGVSGKILNVIEIYKSGDLKSSAGPTGGMGMGRGMGRGMGCGRGRGMGVSQVGGSRQPAGGTYQTTGQQSIPGNEITHLKDRAEALAEELTNIQKRIEQIESQQ